MKYLQNNNLEVNSSVRGENTILRPAFSLSHLKSRCRTPCKTVDFICRTCVRGLSPDTVVIVSVTRYHYSRDIITRVKFPCHSRSCTGTVNKVKHVIITQ